MVLEERIRRDAALFADDPEAAALLECLGRHLLDPAHDLASMLKLCGARGDRVAWHSTSTPPPGYCTPGRKTAP